MNILIDIGHPGHVHFFKNFIWEMEKKGHNIIVTARKKDVVESLLDQYKIKYSLRGSLKKSTVNKALDMPRIDMKLIRIIRKYNIDCVMGVLNPYVAHSSSITGRKSYIFSDTEHAKLAIKLTIPFCTKVLTPFCYIGDLGSKQIRYNGYHELAYLHPNWFKPDPNVIAELGLDKNDKYVIIRFISWGASHDIGHTGFTLKEKFELIKNIEKHAQPFITSEGKLPKKLRKYQINIPPHQIHNAMYYSQMCVGESGTMSTEAAILGVPSLRVSTIAKYVGVFNELKNKYKLLYFYDYGDKCLEKVTETLASNSRQIWKNRRKKLLKEKIDVTKFMINFIEKKGYE